MSNVTRLTKFANMDHVNAKERLIFTERRSRRWTLKILPIIAALLALFLVWRDASGATVWGRFDDSAYILVRHPSGPKCPPGVVLEFTIILTAERG